VEIAEFGVLTKPLFVERAADAIAARVNGIDAPNVLIADEDPHVRQILSDALSAAGCRIKVAADGREAFRSADESRPDLLLLSLTLRGGNGVSTLVRVRAHPRVHNVPVIMLVPRELSVEQMEELTVAAHQLLAQAQLPRRSILELLQVPDHPVRGGVAAGHG
jgi:CheY-like chemotaxis protein